MDPNQIAPPPPGHNSNNTCFPVVWLNCTCKYNNQIHHAKMSRLPVKHMTSIECTLNVLSVFLDFSLTVKAAPHECVIRTGQP